MAEREISPEVRAFLNEMAVPCVISTLRPDGSPITSATLYGFIGEDVVVSTPAKRNKARNVREDPRVSFIVDTKEAPYRGIAIEGTAELTEDTNGNVLRSILERYVSFESALETSDRLESMGQRTILRIKPERVRTWGF
ncbi:MAG TPA: PPOX class F420-dependent oxidoreductase [Dehalococcoidia bacterium]|nr:PPOX class F420-dependent oxidoreductase [Dehalococcoidia bacterium]